VLLFSVECKFSKKEFWFEGESKVIQGPLPSWVRPKRITKRCNQHAQQERTTTKVFVRVETIKMTSPKCGSTTAS